MSAPFGTPSTTNPQAERAVIAALIRNPDGELILRLGISADLFTDHSAREAFAAIVALITDGITPDAATLKNAVSDATLIEIETSLAEHCSAANLTAHVRLLKDCYRERTVQAARSRLAQAATMGAPEHELTAIVESINAAGSGKRKSTFYSLIELMKNPPSESWLVDNYFPTDSLCVLFGETGCGKSFLLIDLLCHIAAGVPWRGNKVKQGKVLYIAGEGANGIIKRFQAWFQKNGFYHAAENITVRTIPAALCDKESTAELLEEIGDMPENPVAIGIDTLQRNFGPGDENSTRDMGMFVAAVDKIRKATGAMVAIPHHTGHAEKNRGRGSSALKAAIDVEFLIENNSTIVSMRCHKMKDADDSPPLAWERTKLVWTGPHGKLIDSAVLVPTDAVPSHAAERPAKLSPSQRIALDALETALMRDGVERDGRVSVAEDQWRQAAYDAGIAAADLTQQAKRRAFQRAREALLSAKLVATHDGRYWIQAIGTKRYKAVHVPACTAGYKEGEAVQSGTHPYKGVPHVPPTCTPNMGEPENNETPSPPATCVWDRWNDRLLVKCADPAPNEDRTGCANCGASKP